MHATVVSLFAALLCSTSCAAQFTDGALFRENFEGSYHEFFDTGDLSVSDYVTNNVTYGHYCRVEYQPTDRGTTRLYRRFDLPEEVSEATLSFDMKLHSEFEFVKGGKMHGLSGGAGTTGCKEIVPDGWTVRMMWRREGVPVLYVYHQQRGRCGTDVTPDPAFSMQRGVWYHINIHVRMNSGLNTYDGVAALYFDGVKVAERADFNFVEDPSTTKIDEFFFSTFYGGSNSTWSPTKTTIAYYDNFLVKRGKHITGVDSFRCNTLESGIYSTSGACCAQSCGSCGGSGCAYLPGGSDCCTAPILDSNIPCSASDVSAPCVM